MYSPENGSFHLTFQRLWGFKLITLRMGSQSNVPWEAEERCFQAGESTTGQQDWEPE